MEDRTKIFINLTDGLEWLEVLSMEGPLPHLDVTRISSTKFEQGLLNQIIEEMDTNLLLYLALGYTVIILDCGSRKSTGESRVIWYGIPVLKYILNWRWFNQERDASGKYLGVSKYSHPLYVGSTNIQHEIDYFMLYGLSTKAKRKLDYFKKYTQSSMDHVDLRGLSIKAQHDGDYDLYAKIAQTFL